MRGRWSLAIAGVVLILAGGLLAHFTQTAGGIQIQDVRFKGAKGNTMSALLYIPPNATRADPGPRHPRGPRLHQFARDPGRLCHRIRPPRLCGARARPDRPRLQRPARLRQRLRRPDGLAHLRSLDIVDKNNIGLEGHSMGGWTVLAAATAMPNDYKSMVLEGSSTGKPFAADGTAELAAQRRAGVRAIRGILDADVGRRPRPRRHPEPETLGAVRHARRRSNPARSMATSRKARRGCSTRPRSPIRPSTFRTRRSATASTGSPRPCRAARRAGRRPDLVPQGDRHADRAARLCRAADRRLRRRCWKRRCFPGCGCPRSPTAPCRSMSRPAAAAGPRRSSCPPSSRR